MASKNPGACCLKVVYHEGETKGQFKEIAGLDTYQTGEKFGDEEIIVILTDIYGYKLSNVLLIADQLAEMSCRQVLIPDILMGEPITPSDDFSAWLEKHSSETTKPIVDGFLAQLTKEKSPKSLFGIGYCFGAKYCIQNLTKDGYLTAGAVAHPSFVSVEEVEAVTKPILISAAETDSIFPEELRNKTIQILAANKIRYQLDLFLGVSHGFAVKGDLSISEVKYAKEKVLIDQVYFFSQF
mmetsp:Transcript_2130/g.2085  ORF Transcript_2130/g.2085 Transcript_2130/m.2085 type:complete len:240 (-) Transcript_2130:109-828(-)